MQDLDCDHADVIHPEQLKSLISQVLGGNPTYHDLLYAVAMVSCADLATFSFKDLDAQIGDSAWFAAGKRSGRAPLDSEDSMGWIHIWGTLGSRGVRFVSDLYQAGVSARELIMGSRQRY